MEKNIFIKMMKYKNGDKNSLLEIIEIFNPLISKYSRLLDKEDTRQDLIIHLIKVIDNIPIHNKNLLKNNGIFRYIARAIRNEYIKLSQKRDKIRLNEKELSSDIEISYENYESELVILDMFKVLSKKEAYIMKLIYVYYLSVSEVADYMKISRQAVNQSKNRALKKIRKLYFGK